MKLKRVIKMSHILNIKKLLLVLFFGLPFFASAGTSVGVVTTPLVSGDIFMFAAGTHTDKPACATQGFAPWAISLNTQDSEIEGAKTMVALVLSAQAQKKKLSVTGKGTCTIWGDREDVLYLYIMD